MNPAKIAFNPKKHTIYKPINEEKYADKDQIICKSSWEVAFCNWCDRNPNILKWSSETVEIPYYDPLKRKMRRYYPDFSIIVLDKNGKENKYIIEIKPKKETVQPVRNGKKERIFLYEWFTYQTNVAKWIAAENFCRKYGLKFKILTEDDLYIMPK